MPCLRLKLPVPLEIVPQELMGRASVLKLAAGGRQSMPSSRSVASSS